MIALMSSSPPETSARPFSEMSNEAVATTTSSSTISGAEVQPSIIEARMAGNGKIVIVETRFQDELRTKGFGEKEDAEYILKPYEALYLFHTKRLKLKNKPETDFNSLFELLLKHNRNIMSEFLVYRDLRSRGYVAKEGFGFGVDFRVYERGQFDTKPAKYVVFGINEGINLEVNDFSQIIKDIGKMGKDAIIAVVERRGEIIYYKVSTMHFTEIKNF